MLRHWPPFVPDMSTDIRGHEALHQHHQLTTLKHTCMALESKCSRRALPSPLKTNTQKPRKKNNFASENLIRNEDAAERLEKSVCMLQPAWLESEILSNHDAVRF